MKNLSKILAGIALLLLTTSPSHAWVSVGFRVGHVRVGINPFWPVYPAPVYVPQPVVYAPPPVVYAQPVVVQQPVVMQQPVYQEPQPPASPPVNTMIPDPEALAPVPAQENKASLGDFHNRMTRAQNILDRQLGLGGVTQTQYDRETQNLAKLTEDERKWASDNKGSLTIGEVNNLSVRLSQVEQQIQLDLSGQ